MAIDFPNSPTNGQTYTVGSTEWTYDGEKWKVTNNGVTGPQGPQGAQGAAGATGQGVPTGGATGQILSKSSATNYDTGWINPPPGGLALVKSQTIGSAVTSISVTNAFSASYDAYEIIVSGGNASGNIWLSLQLGNSTSGYYWNDYVNYYYGTYHGVGYSTGSSNWPYVFGCTNALGGNIEGHFFIRDPYLNKSTRIHGASAYNAHSHYFIGYHSVQASYTDFTLAAASGNVTGGEIRVYGYAI